MFLLRNKYYCARKCFKFAKELSGVVYGVSLSRPFARFAVCFIPHLDISVFCDDVSSLVWKKRFDYSFSNYVKKYFVRRFGNSITKFCFVRGFPFSSLGYNCCRLFPPRNFVIGVQSENI